LFEEEQQLQRNKTFCRSGISLGKEGDECLYEGKAPWKEEVKTEKNFMKREQEKISFS